MIEKFNSFIERKIIMPKWLKKSLVILITTLTFGMVAPPAYLLADDNNNEQSLNSYTNDRIEIKHELHTKEAFLQQVTNQALNQSYEKFGSKIGPVIKDEFNDVILPKIEYVLSQLTEQYPEEELQNLVISESPSGGHSEKIFHIYHSLTGKDIIRFHVRKDHPPLDGYYFNFHYHTHHDDFQMHHTLGSIFWSKNTPPKWMS